MRDFLLRWGVLFIDPQRLIALLRLPRYVSDWISFRRQQGAMPVPLLDTFPRLDDWLEKTPFDPHYFYQGNWLARRVAAEKPSRHVDVGSSVLTVGILSAFVPTVFVDYRPLHVAQQGLMSIGGDITRLPFADGSLISLSCLHVIEHIGLGRYGDPLDADGARRAALELQRVVAEGGKLYLSTPIGRERVCFNAHRVFAISGVVAMFPGLRLTEFSYVDDGGVLHGAARSEDRPELEYGCGFFEFTK